MANLLKGVASSPEAVLDLRVDPSAEYTLRRLVVQGVDSGRIVQHGHPRRTQGADSATSDRAPLPWAHSAAAGVSALWLSEVVRKSRQRSTSRSEEVNQSYEDGRHLAR